jgi:hypothetical protein
MTQTNIIILKAYYGRQQGPLSLNPVKDLNTGKFRGVKLLSEQKKLDAIKVIDGNTTRRISDGLTLDLSDPVDALDWDWIKENKEIVASEQEANDNPQALFYVYHPDKEIDVALEKFDLNYEATKLVKESTPEERRDLCRYLGMNVDGFRDKDILEYLAGRVKSSPKTILKAAEDPNYKEKLFLQQLLDAALFKKDSNGIIKYGDIIVGLNKDAAIVWLNDSRNRELVGKLYARLYSEPSLSSTSSVIDEFESMQSGSKNNNAEATEETL